MPEIPVSVCFFSTSLLMNGEIPYSELKEFKHLEFLAKQVVEGFITGLHKSPFHGFSVEFAEHKLYNKGDSTRHIDWKLYARTDKLFVKKYEEETNLRCQLVIDASSSMFFPSEEENKINKLRFSVYCAAAIIELMRKQRDAVGLSLFSSTLFTHTPAKSAPAHINMLYSELEKLLHKYNPESAESTIISNTLHEIAEAIHKRSLVIIFTDMLDSRNNEELFSALQHLKHNKHEILLFHVYDKAIEEALLLQNRPYRFIDMETKEELKLNPSEYRDKYARLASEYSKEIKLKCAQYRIDYIEADINNGFAQVLLPYLLKRTKLM